MTVLHTVIIYCRNSTNSQENIQTARHLARTFSRLWGQPLSTLRFQTKVDSRVQAPLQGFLRGWSQGKACVHSCSSWKAFRRTDRWILGLGEAIRSTPDLLAVSCLSSLLSRDLASRSYVYFFYRQYLRIAKYQARGIAMVNISPFQDVLNCLQFVVEELLGRK